MQKHLIFIRRTPAYPWALHKHAFLQIPLPTPGGHFQAKNAHDKQPYVKREKNLLNNVVLAPPTRALSRTHRGDTCLR